MLGKIDQYIIYNKLPTKNTKANAQKAPMKDLKAKELKTWN